MLLFVLVVIILVLLKKANVGATNNVRFPIIEKERYKKNCNIDTVYSMSDELCARLCDNSGLFVARHGICVNSLVFDQAAVENNCNGKDGVLAYLVGSAELGNTYMMCLSVDPGVRPNNLKLPNTLCQNGAINIDYESHFPQLSECVCNAEDETLIEIPNTSVVRTRGYCAKNNLLPIFELNNLVYNPNKIY